MYEQTIVCISAEDVDWFKERFTANLAFMDVEIVPGGATRAESVQNALSRVNADVDFVAVHDAARPLLVKQWINAVFAAAREERSRHSCSAAVQYDQTGGREDDCRDGRSHVSVCGTDTAGVRAPGAARCVRRRDGYDATDEAELVERIGQPSRSSKAGR